MNRKERRLKKSRGGRAALLSWGGREHTIPEAGELAVRELQRRNFAGVVEICDLILARAAGSAEVLNRRGVALMQLRRYGEALLSFDQAVVRNPGHAEGWNNRGAVLQKLQRHEDALVNYDRAIALKPGYANAWHNRGSLLKQTGRYEEALKSHDQAIALNPAHVEAHNNRGVLLQEMKRYAAALASFDRVIALQPGHVEARQNRGVLMVGKGDMAEAEKMFRQALELKPDFAAPLFGLANIHQYRDVDDPVAKTIRFLLGRPGDSTDDQEYLYFSLGKIYDDCGRHDEAFEWYRRANELRNAAVFYDAARVTQATNDTVEFFSRSWLAQTPAFASPSRPPLFIVGMPRSGTTLLAQMLSNHRSIGTAGELPAISDLAAHLLEGVAGRIPWPQSVMGLTPAVAARLAADYEERLRRDAGPDQAQVIDKNPLNFANVGFIARLFPNAKIIHCTRHPLDTGLSNYFQRFPARLNYSFDLGNIGHFYGEYARLMEHWRGVLPGKMLEISYEETVLNTEPVARRVIDFLGLEWDERCLAPHTNPHPVESASQWQVRQPIYRHSLERWRHYEKHLGPLKEALRRAGHIYV